ncbi:SGNH/GDSL hydrolase family protein [Enterococcus sp. LJL99]
MEWRNVWSYTQQDYRSWPSVIDNDRQVIRIRSNHFTNQLKIRFSNEYGQEKISLDAVSICLLEPETLAIRARKTVTVNGKKKITLLPSIQLISDSISLDIQPGSILEIETIITKKTILQSGTVSYSRRELEVYNYQATNHKQLFVEQRELFRMVKENERMFFVYAISGVDFFTDKKVKTIVAFGDSLTQQGFWVDHLKRRLFLNHLEGYAVLNRGIGGSRILKGQNPINDSYNRHGNAGLYRFEREIFMFGSADIVVCLHGINDLISRHDGTNEYPYSVQEIKMGLKQYAQLAHQHNTKLIIGTLMPIGHSIFYSSSLEIERCELNDWIRNSDYFDGVIDFDKVVREKEKSNLLQCDYDCGDGLHVSDQGGKRMAEAVDLEFLISLN